MIVIDTSVIYALLDGRDQRHQEAVEWYEETQPDVATTPLILAEVDHLATTRAGAKACDAWRDDVARGAYDVQWWPGAATATVAVARTYNDLGLGLSDASLVALAERLGVQTIATFDQHFRVVRPARFAAFVLAPTDDLK